MNFYSSKISIAFRPIQGIISMYPWGDSLVMCEGILASTFFPSNLVQISNQGRICQFHYYAVAASLVFRKINWTWLQLLERWGGVTKPLFFFLLFPYVFDNYQNTGHLYDITFIFDTCHRSWTAFIWCEPFLTNRNATQKSWMRIKTIGYDSVICQEWLNDTLISAMVAM